MSGILTGSFHFCSLNLAFYRGGLFAKAIPAPPAAHCNLSDSCRLRCRLANGHLDWTGSKILPLRGHAENLVCCSTFSLSVGDYWTEVQVRAQF